MKDSLTKTICFFHSAQSFTEREQQVLAACKEEVRNGNEVILVTSMYSQLGAKGIQERLNVYKFRIGKLSYLNPFKFLVLSIFLKTKSVNEIRTSNPDDFKLVEVLKKFAASST